MEEVKTWKGKIFLYKEDESIVGLDDGNIKVYASYGFLDIFSRTIYPIKHGDNFKGLYNKKVIG